MRPSRREFLKWGTVSGIALSVARFPTAQAADFDVVETLPGKGAPVPGLGRVDGFAKVTGAKLYVSDFRARDMDGWPPETAHALLVRTPDATHIHDGIDLDALGADARPTVVVTAAEIAKGNFRVPPFYTGDLFCPVGQTPLYLGQPVALLLFDSFDAYDRLPSRG